MVDGLQIASRRINPRFEHFQDEKIIGPDQTGIDHFALEIRKAFGYQGWGNARCGNRRQRKPLELRDVAARAITDLDHGVSEVNSWNGDYTLFRDLQRLKAVIGVA